MGNGCSPALAPASGVPPRTRTLLAVGQISPSVSRVCVQTHCAAWEARTAHKMPAETWAGMQNVGPLRPRRKSRLHPPLTPQPLHPILPSFWRSDCSQVQAGVRVCRSTWVPRARGVAAAPVPAMVQPLPLHVEPRLLLGWRKKDPGCCPRWPTPPQQEAV